MDKRSKKVIFLSHCLLNPNTVYMGGVKGREQNLKFVKLLFENDIGIVQMPCPELGFRGLIRAPATKKIYDTKKFRAIAKSLAKNIANLIDLYVKNDFKVLGVVGIRESPSCGISKTLLDRKNGEKIFTSKPGIFIEELKKTLKQLKISVPMIDVNRREIDLADIKRLIR